MQDLGKSYRNGVASFRWIEFENFLQKGKSIEE